MPGHAIGRLTAERERTEAADVNESTNSPAGGDALTPAKVAASAIQQAARHERALKACLAELCGIDAPDSGLSESIRQRATRHAQRAVGLTWTAIRMNEDPLAEAFFAALLERHERNALHVQVLLESSEAALAPAG